MLGLDFVGRVTPVFKILAVLHETEMYNKLKYAMSPDCPSVPSPHSRRLKAETLKLGPYSWEGHIDSHAE